MKNSTLKAPAHLRPDTRAWWQTVHQDYDLGEHHSRLLTMACEAWDRACQAREILAKDGIIIGGREAAARPHPAGDSASAASLKNERETYQKESFHHQHSVLALVVCYDTGRGRYR